MLPVATAVLLVSEAVRPGPARFRVKNTTRPFVAALWLAACCAHAQTPAEALFRSIENGDFAEFSRLVDTGVDLSTKNKLGETPLYVAAEKGQLQMAKLLIARGADAKAQTPNGESVLHAAAMIESMALMTALIEAGADKDSANNDGERLYREKGAGHSRPVERRLA